MPSWDDVVFHGRELVDLPLFHVGKTPITPWTVAYLTVLLIVLVYVSGRLRGWIVNRLLTRTHLDIGVRQSVGSIVRYATFLVGLFVILQSAGIDLSSLAIVAGALGIGVGLGLQTITNNLVSGLIILFERPVKVGDRVEVGTVHGNVTRIGPRATTVVTNDNIAVIVPNSEFITTRVINWSYTDRDVRFRIPVGVAYGSDPRTVEKLLLEAAAATPGVLKLPPSDVLFRGFGDSALNFELRVWTREFTPRPGVLRSHLYFQIHRILTENGIEIPFPQRDLHIRDGALRLERDPGGPGGDRVEGEDAGSRDAGAPAEPGAATRAPAAPDHPGRAERSGGGRGPRRAGPRPGAPR